MSTSDLPLSQVVSQAQTRAIQEALKPHLAAMGVRKVEASIGKPRRFFANLRQRDTLKVRDFLATCSVLELDPVEFLRETLGDEIAAEVRPPRIIGRAWRRAHDDGPGVGEARLAELEASMQSRPRQTRTALAKEVDRAKRDELPRLLGLYGSSYRIESDLDRARVVLTQAREMAKELRLPAAEADILIRSAYVSLENDHLEAAIRHAEKAIVLSARIQDHEGEGIGFLALGMFRLYSKEYQKALDDLAAALALSEAPRQQAAAHQVSALCLIELGREAEAQAAIERARNTAQGADGWVRGKIVWVEARLNYGPKRLALLSEARDALSPKRHADCALVTVELIEEALALGRDELAEQATLNLCALLEKTGSPRVEHAIHHLIRHRTRLSPDYVSRVRRAVETAQARRLARVIRSDH